MMNTACQPATTCPVLSASDNTSSWPIPNIPNRWLSPDNLQSTVNELSAVTSDNPRLAAHLFTEITADWSHVDKADAFIMFHKQLFTEWTMKSEFDSTVKPQMEASRQRHYFLVIKP